MSIPQAVLGGMSTFLFVGVYTDGRRLTNANHLDDAIHSRNRFILTAALALGYLQRD
ncbi:hypothetical protein BGX38DRAFT_1275642 [Terfezia claveryi]|nr:hypothetical protein BGX38DRAFT_1275642 [Terfezia claveryi]